MNHNVVIFSGGMDSFTLLYLLAQHKHKASIATLSFMYGQRHVREIEATKQAISFLYTKFPAVPISSHLVDLRTAFNQHANTSALTGAAAIPEGHYAAETMRKTVVPGRNTIMLAHAMGFAEALAKQWGHKELVVSYGAHAGDHHIYPDCRPEFIAAMGTLYEAATEGVVKLSAPFGQLSKGEVLAWGLEAGLTAEDYANTWTCYVGGQHPCGKCGACVERAEAFDSCGAVDPLVTAAIASGIDWKAHIGAV